MLQPKRTKWRRSHLVRPKKQASRGNTVAFGSYGLAATEGGYIDYAKGANIAGFCKVADAMCDQGF